MRKVIVSEMLSVDGYFSGPNGEMDWFISQDAKLDEYALELLNTIDTIIYGEATYNLMVGFWPHAPGPFAERTNKIEKRIVSKKLTNTPWGEWNNASPLTGDLGDEIKKLKQQDGKDIVVYGSGSIVRQLADLGLVDEYRLIVNPVILGKGVALFGDVSHKHSLELLNATTFPSGGVALTYKPKK